MFHQKHRGTAVFPSILESFQSGVPQPSWERGSAHQGSRQALVADPEFLRWGGGSSTPEFGAEESLLFYIISTENCMKMKEIGPRGGRMGHPP